MKHALIPIALIFAIDASAQVEAARDWCSFQSSEFGPNCSFERWNNFGFGDEPQAWVGNDRENLGHVRRSTDFHPNHEIPGNNPGYAEDTVSAMLEVVVGTDGLRRIPALYSFQSGVGHTVRAPLATVHGFWKASFTDPDDERLHVEVDVRRFDPDQGFDVTVAYGTAQLTTESAMESAWTQFTVPVQVLVGDFIAGGAIVTFTLADHALQPALTGSRAWIDNVFYSGATTTPAAANRTAADAAAVAFASDAALVQVEGNDLDESGAAQEWVYTYYSDTANKTGAAAAHGFVLLNGAVVSDFAVDIANLHSTSPLPARWLDSRPAAVIAEQHSNGFRSRHTDATVSAVLAPGLTSETGEGTTWRLLYSAANESITLFVDAETRAVTVDIETFEKDIPKTLYANYPNPFRGTTTIPYDLAMPSDVSLKVIDVLGRTVNETSVNAQLPGNHELVFDASSLSSGIYVYRLEAGGMIASRRMVVLK